MAVVVPERENAGRIDVLEPGRHEHTRCARAVESYDHTTKQSRSPILRRDQDGMQDLKLLSLPYKI